MAGAGLSLVAAPKPSVVFGTVERINGGGHGDRVAAANRVARRLAAIRSGDAGPAPSDQLAALRDVVNRCIHGVDINPMAVELCKVALWLESIDPGRPARLA